MSEIYVPRLGDEVKIVNRNLNTFGHRGIIVDFGRDFTNVDMALVTLDGRRDRLRFYFKSLELLRPGVPEYE